MGKKKQNNPDPAPAEGPEMRKWESYVPDGRFYIDPSRMDRFTWNEGDLVPVRPARRKKQRTARKNTPAAGPSDGKGTAGEDDGSESAGL